MDHIAHLVNLEEEAEDVNREMPHTLLIGDWILDVKEVKTELIGRFGFYFDLNNTEYNQFVVVDVAPGGFGLIVLVLSADVKGAGANEVTPAKKKTEVCILTSYLFNYI